MAVTYTWFIEHMNCYPSSEGQQNVVFNVAWRLTGVDGEFSNSLHGSAAIEPYKSGDPFTPYEQLTEEQVLGWVKETLGADQISEYESAIANRISSLASPPVVIPPLPWA